MKANTRDVPGSTWSCRIPFFGLAALSWRSSKSTYKTQTKYRQNRECDFITCYVSDTYNFNSIKCLHFIALERFPLPRREGRGEGQTGYVRSRVPASRHLRVSAPLPCEPTATAPFKYCINLGGLLRYLRSL